MIAFTNYSWLRLFTIISNLALLGIIGIIFKQIYLTYKYLHSELEWCQFDFMVYQSLLVI